MRNILKDRRFFVFKAGSVGFVAIALALLCVFSCNNLIVLGGGSLVIAMPGTRAATASSYTIELTGTNGTPQSKTLTGGTTAQFDDLAPDTYSIVVKGMDTNDKVVLGGASSATVVAGKTASTTVELVEVVNNFDSLRQAMTAGGTVYVVNDITVTESLTINQDVTIRALDKDVTLNHTGSSNLFTVQNSATLTIGGGDYRLTVDGNGQPREVALLQIKGGTVDLYGTITNGSSTKTAGGVEIASSSTLYMYDGATVSNCECTDGWGRGGAIAVRSGAVMNMYGGTITGNRCYCAAAIYVEGGTFNMSGGTITGNTATSSSTVDSDRPSAVEITSTGKFTQTGGSITGNSPSDIANKSTLQ